MLYVRRVATDIVQGRWRRATGEVRSAVSNQVMMIPPRVRATGEELGSVVGWGETGVQLMLMPNEAVLFVPALAVAL